MRKSNYVVKVSVYQPVGNNVWQENTYIVQNIPVFIDEKRELQKSSTDAVLDLFISYLTIRAFGFRLCYPTDNRGQPSEYRVYIQVPFHCKGCLRTLLYSLRFQA